jgi:hypothetical protein
LVLVELLEQTLVLTVVLVEILQLLFLQLLLLMVAAEEVA